MNELDAFTDLFDGPRARGAFALRALLSPPWGLRILAESPLALMAIVSGEAWIVPDEGEPIRLGPGDVAVTRAPDHYSVLDSPNTEPNIIIHSGQDCRTPDGRSLKKEMALDVRTWGNDPNGSTVMLVGAYESMGDVSERLLRALPPVLALADDKWESPLVTMLANELVKDLPGQGAVLDRLLDLLLLAVLREWFSRAEAQQPTWYRSQADPVVGKAINAMQKNSAQQWTVATLASHTGVSRSALSRRFHEVVGEPPMKFLTEWRLALAADLLCEPEATVGSVAERVGYGTPFALSAAFKRVRGISPLQHQQRQLTAN